MAKNPQHRENVVESGKVIGTSASARLACYQKVLP
jgi:hypothetical protein